MKKHEQNALSMWRAVRQYLDAYSDVWIGNTPFKNASTALTESIGKARAAMETQARNSKGISGERDAQEHEAISQMLAISRCTCALALDTGNNILLDAVHYGKSILTHYPQNMLAARLRNMLKAAVEYREALVDYGVAGDAFSTAAEAIARLEEAQISVRTTISGKKAVTGTVPSIMESGRVALKKMDHLVHVFEPLHAAFVSGYKTTRGIVHSGTRHRQDDAEAA